MRVKMSIQPPPAPTASAVGPCPTVIQIVGRPGTGSLPSTIAERRKLYTPRHTLYAGGIIRDNSYKTYVRSFFPVFNILMIQFHNLCLLVCFWLIGPLRQYFSLYRTVPKREGEDERKDSGE